MTNSFIHSESPRTLISKLFKTVLKCVIFVGEYIVLVDAIHLYRPKIIL